MAHARPLKVFLCHASADKPAVRQLYQHLIELEIDAWLDIEKLSPGQDWQIEIPKAIKSSDVIIICLSKDSINKEGYVQKEIKFALDKADEMPEGRIFLIPARLDNCSVLHSLEKIHYVDLFEETGCVKLFQSIQTYIEQSGAKPLFNQTGRSMRENAKQLAKTIIRETKWKELRAQNIEVQNNFIKTITTQQESKKTNNGKVLTWTILVTFFASILSIFLFFFLPTFLKSIQETSIKQSFTPIKETETPVINTPIIATAAVERSFVTEISLTPSALIYSPTIVYKVLDSTATSWPTDTQFPTATFTPTITSTPSFTPITLQGDLNHDSVVDCTDFNIFLLSYRSERGSSNYNIEADFDANGYINILDLGQYTSLFTVPVTNNCQ